MQSNSILVIESDDALREAVIGTVGVAVPAVGAESGSEALRLLEEQSPAIVLLNLQLQDMDGFTVLERVRERLPEARVIVTSDSGNYDLVCHVTEVGVGDFLEKPYSTEDLFQSLNNSMQRVSRHLDYWTLASRHNQKSRMRRRAALAYA